MTFSRLISVAPMMAYTDKHCRYFHRLLSKNVLLYTEMITTGALIYGDRESFLTPEILPGPAAYQLGGSDPKDLATCAKWIEETEFCEVNLNVGCPSDRVKRGCFGLSLLKTPSLVFECVDAMKSAVNIPVTVKTRIGYDHNDSYESLCSFIEGLVKAKCDHVTIHARKGWLEGLNPQQNRTIPPLKYDIVYQLKKDFPDLSIGINGGINNLIQIKDHLTKVDSAMIGRAFFHDPFMLANLDSDFYKDPNAKKITREEIVFKMADYADMILQDKANQKNYRNKLSHITKAMLGLYLGQRNGKVWRRFLCDQVNISNDKNNGDLLRNSLEIFDTEVINT